MNICSDGHDEVCYEIAVCPACVLKQELETAQDDIATLEKQVDELQSQLDDLK